MMKKISLLMILWSFLGLGLAGLGCGGDDGGAGDPMPCDGDFDCPSGYFCGVSETCVPLLTFDEEACPEDDPDCLEPLDE